MNKPLYGQYKINIEYFNVPKRLKVNFGKQFMTNKLIEIIKNQNQCKKH